MQHSVKKAALKTTAANRMARMIDPPFSPLVVAALLSSPRCFGDRYSKRDYDKEKARRYPVAMPSTGVCSESVYE